MYRHQLGGEKGVIAVVSDNDRIVIELLTQRVEKPARIDAVIALMSTPLFAVRRLVLGKLCGQRRIVARLADARRWPRPTPAQQLARQQRPQLSPGSSHLAHPG